MSKKYNKTITIQTEYGTFADSGYPEDKDKWDSHYIEKDVEVDPDNGLKLINQIEEESVNILMRFRIPKYCIVGFLDYLDIEAWLEEDKIKKLDRPLINSFKAGTLVHEVKKSIIHVTSGPIEFIVNGERGLNIIIEDPHYQLNEEANKYLIEKK